MNKTSKIETSSFGLIVIDGRQYTSDLMIYPDGQVKDSWWRKSGHSVTIDDIGELVDSEPEVIVVGTGVNGLMKPVMELGEALSVRGIKLISLPNQEAIEVFNDLSSEKRVGACFHLTC
jgi:hypothetical protein